MTCDFGAMSASATAWSNSIGIVRGGELTYRAAAAALKRPLLTATRALDDDTNDDGAADAADADAAAACTLLQINRRGQVHAVRSL